MGWRAPGAGDRDAAAFELLAAWLGGGNEAQLPAALVRDWQVAFTAQAGFSPLKEGSLFWTLAVVPPNADSLTVERLILDTVRRAASEGPRPFEVERARRQVETATGFALQTARQRGLALGEAEMLAGDAHHVSARLAALHVTTASDLQRAAQRLLADGTRATLWLSPAPAGGGR
jgi:predicted Zn-dependent peptidase